MSFTQLQKLKAGTYNCFFTEAQTVTQKSEFS